MNNRKIVQIATLKRLPDSGDLDTLVALCDYGSVWLAILSNNPSAWQDTVWEPISDVPQDDPPTA